MKVLGIIVEYNPFHNGHIYHIQKAKEITKCDYTIAVMSSSFVQRGEPAIIDKWTRSQLAIEFGVDLVVELPFVYSVQSADYFAKGALKILNALHVTDICFGSEDGHIETFLDIAQATSHHQDWYNQIIKEKMSQGIRYPDACNQALQIIMNKNITTPNDLLGLSYVKEIIQNNYPIKPHCFKRSTHYHSTQISHISSATAIRHALKHNQDISHTLPHPHLYHQDLFFLQDLFPFLKYQLLTTTPFDLSQFHLVEEGLENVMLKNIQQSHCMEDFIQSLLSKRYTRPRIQRMLIHVLMKNTKEQVQDALNIDYVHVLSMNTSGQRYLHHIKKNCQYHILTQFSKHRHPALMMEFKATKLLSLLSSNPNDFIQKEFNHIPINKK